MFFVQSIKFLLRCQLALFGDLQTTSFSIFIPAEVMLCLSVFVLIACSKFYRVTSSFQLQQVLIRMKAIRRRSKRIYPFSFILLCILKLEHLVMFHRIRQAGARGWSWSGVREKHCYLAGGWRLELEWCERELL